jgi:hypothetical protein
MCLFVYVKFVNRTALLFTATGRILKRLEKLVTLSTNQTIIFLLGKSCQRKKSMGPLQLLNCCYLFSIVVRICVSFSICRKCLYDTNVTKYLVLVKDDVEAGDERLKEFEQELQDMGLFDTQFSLGDLLDEEEAETNTDQPPETKKKKLEEFPPIEGEESLMEYIGQFKKACLTRKANLKTAKERLERDKASGHEMLASNCLLTNQQLKYVDKHTQILLATAHIQFFVRTDFRSLQDSASSQPQINSQNPSTWWSTCSFIRMSHSSSSIGLLKFSR